MAEGAGAMRIDLIINEARNIAANSRNASPVIRNEPRFVRDYTYRFVPRPCKNCGKEITEGHRNDKHYCSTSCRIASLRQRKQAQ